MSTHVEIGTTVKVFRIYINATPEAIWEAITTPEWATKYGYRAPFEVDLRPGGAYRVLSTPDMIEKMGAPEVLIDGEVIEADPPRRLVQTWRVLWDPELEAEGFTQVTYDIEEDDHGVTRLTLTHELDGAPKTAATVLGRGRLKEGGGGWPWILSDLKTLLESGRES